MIYSNITVTISGGQSKINEKIILFRGDRDVQVSFEIIQTSFKFAKGENVINAKDAGYGQLIIEKPDQSHIFSEITECENGRVIFTITADMIDELNEVGSYAIQIRLFDSTAGSRITLPAISNAIEVLQPMASEDLSVATVGTASIDYAVINDEGELDDFFNDDNSYKLTQWYTGDKITAGRMNKIEGAIYEINDKIENVEIPTKVSDLENDKGYLTEHQSLTDYATKDEIPTKVSDLENDKGYLTEHQSLTDYATKSYVGEAINALRTELMALINSGDSGGGNKTPIDLSETYPIANSYLYSNGTVYDDARGRGMYNIPLSDYTDFYITATSLYSATIMVIYDSNGSVLGHKGKDAENGVTWTDEHIVVSDLLEEHPTASYISLSSFSLSSANTTLIVYATPV